MIAETLAIRENPCTAAGRCSVSGCVRDARMHVCAAGTVLRASTFTCHGHVQDGHVRVLRAFAKLLEDNLAEARGEYEPVPL